MGVLGIARNHLALSFRQKLQYRAALILTSSSYDASADDLIARLDRKKIDVQRKLDTVRSCTMVYKSLNSLAPDYFRSKVTERSEISYSLQDCELRQTCCRSTSPDQLFHLGQLCTRGKGAMRLTLCAAPTRETRPDHNTGNYVPYSFC